MWPSIWPMANTSIHESKHPTLPSQKIQPSTTKYWQHFTILQQPPLRDFIPWRSFIKAISVYQKALDDTGYKHRLNLSAQPTTVTAQPASPTEERRIFWYNSPPHSKNVATNVERSVLKIFDEEFPKNIPIHQIFTRNTVKISYSCMSNIKQNIDRQNKSTIQYSHAWVWSQKFCNCRKPSDCPKNGYCLRKSTVYQATVTTEDNKPKETFWKHF